MNKVFLIGRLVKDPEIRTTSTGKKVASFSLAISDGKDQSGQEITQFFNCSAWERLAEIIEMYVKKGTKVAIFGSLKNRSWDAPDGTKRYATDILAREIEILSSKNESNGDSVPTPPNDDNSSRAPKKVKEEKANDELPEIDINDSNIQMPF
jgi:single-strand DNA-binding protein